MERKWQYVNVTSKEVVNRSQGSGLNCRLQIPGQSLGIETLLPVDLDGDSNHPLVRKKSPSCTGLHIIS